LPLGEFTSARNVLVAQLRKAGRRADATEAKALVKPSVSAWVVNQLYWRHRGLFNRLIEAGDRLRHAQAAQGTGEAAREPAKARREAVTALAKIAEGLLLGGHYSANRDMVRRVTSTLEALSSYGSLPGAPPAGRLTDDVDPPGFEALAGFVPGGTKRRARELAAPMRSPRGARSTKRPLAEQRGTEKRLLAAGKAAVREAERALTVARKQAERAAARLDAAATNAKTLEGQRAQVEKRLARASQDAEGARENASEAAATARDATAGVEGAERALELARRRLQQAAGNED
jgi:hypothetical protein